MVTPQFLLDYLSKEIVKPPPEATPFTGDLFADALNSVSPIFYSKEKPFEAEDRGGVARALGDRIWAFPPPFATSDKEPDLVTGARDIALRMADSGVMYLALADTQKAWELADMSAITAEDLAKKSPVWRAVAPHIQQQVREIHWFPDVSMAAAKRDRDGTVSIYPAGKRNSIAVCVLTNKSDEASNPPVRKHSPFGVVAPPIVVTLGGLDPGKPRYLLHCMAKDEAEVTKELWLPDQKYGEGAGLFRGATTHRAFEASPALYDMAMKRRYAEGDLTPPPSYNEWLEHLLSHAKPTTLAKYDLAWFQTAEHNYRPRVTPFVDTIKVTLKIPYRPEDLRPHQQRNNAAKPKLPDGQSAVSNPVYTCLNNLYHVLREQVAFTQHSTSENPNWFWLKGYQVTSPNAMDVVLTDAGEALLKAATDGDNSDTIDNLTKRFIIKRNDRYVFRAFSRRAPAGEPSSAGCSTTSISGTTWLADDEVSFIIVGAPSFWLKSDVFEFTRTNAPPTAVLTFMKVCKIYKSDIQLPYATANYAVGGIADGLIMPGRYRVDGCDIEVRPKNLPHGMQARAGRAHIE
jgi:hypothetical protein